MELHQATQSNSSKHGRKLLMGHWLHLVQYHTSYIARQETRADNLSCGWVGLGVYSDLIKSLRGASTTIPLALGNLREELQYEQLYLRQKQNFRDQFDVFPDTKTSARRRRHEFASLIEQTLQHLWREFCELEKPFIVSGEIPFVLTMDDGSGNGNSVHHVFSNDEKLPPTTTTTTTVTSGPRRRRSARQSQRRDSYRRNRMGMIEAGLSADRSTYYRTDLSARFLWWWRLNDINSLAQQIQRIQLRRVERDVYETNELVKRGFSLSCRLHGWDPRGDDSDDHSGFDGRGGGGGGGSGSDDGGPRHTHDRASNHVAASSRRSRRKRRSNGTTSLAPGEREFYEREIIRRRARSRDETSPLPESIPPTRQSARQRTGSVVYEYEVVNPGRVYVDVNGARDDRDRPRGRLRSYSRDRD